MSSKPESRLTKGFKTVDKTVMQGRIDSLPVVEQSLRSLMVADKDLRSERDTDEKSKADYRKVKRLSDIISNNTRAATDLRSVTQLIKRAEQIWVTLLLKPNGDQKKLLTYLTENSDIKNVELHDNLLATVEKYFTTQYPIENYLAQIIKDVMFRSGSYVMFNMSHSVLDHLINGYVKTGDEGTARHGMESVLAEHFSGNFNKARNLGYIRKTKRVQDDVEGMESLFGKPAGTEVNEEYNIVDDSLNWTFTDNPLVLKTSQFRQHLRETRIRSVGGQETLQTVMGQIFQVDKKPKKKDNDKANNNSLGIASTQDANAVIKGLYEDRNYRWNESLSVRKSRFYPGTGKGVGITFHVPSEACIPVHANGEIGTPFGYILLVDPDTGEFLKTSSDVKYYQSTRGVGVTNHPGAGSVNEMASHIKTIAQGQDCTVDMSWMIELGNAQLEKDLVEGFINGDLGKSVTVSLTEHNKKIFYSRAMRQQGVRCIFVPSEYVTYIATDFNSLGVGRSLVEEAKLHITRLAVLETADALANIENSISHTELSIVLEKQNPDARNLVAMVRDEWFANNPTVHDIIGYNNVSIDAVLDRFKEQSLTIRVDAGENKAIIAPQITAQQAQREPLKNIDPATREALLDSISGYFNLKRGWLDDSGEGNEFQVEALAEQEMLRNQTSETSALFSRHFSDFMRKHIMCNEPLVADLLGMIKESKKLYQKPASNFTLVEVNKANGGEETSLTEQQEVEMVFLDFLRNFYVELPKPAITDTLNKIDDKIDALDKLVTRWVELSGGAGAIKRLASQIGIEADDLMAQIKGAMMSDAYERFNIPMPFEAVLNKGEGGGLLSMVDGIANLDNNVLRFLTAYVESGKDRKKLTDKLMKTHEKINGPGDGTSEPAAPGMFDEPQSLDEGPSYDAGFSEDELPPEATPTDTDLENKDLNNEEEDETPTDKKPDGEEEEEEILDENGDPIKQEEEEEEEEKDLEGDDDQVKLFGEEDLPPA